MQTTLNGQVLDFEPRAIETALDVIRQRAGLTGTKLACGGGICGACTVLVDGMPTCSCLMPATHMEGKQIQTVEAHGAQNLHPVQKALLAHDGLQCGFCTPGFVNSGIAFYEQWRHARGTETPTRDEVALALGGNLCRCAAYVGIYAAIQQACAGDFDAVNEVQPPRVDALEKVTGAAKYTVDVVLPGQLEGKILRSVYPHAIIKAVDVAAARAMDGVVAVADLMQGQTRVRYVGQPIYGVAAVDEHTAAAALAAIRVDYDVQPAVIGMEQAQADGAPEVYADDKSHIPVSAEGFNLPGTWQNNVRRSLVKATSWRPAAARRRVDAARAGQPTNLVEHTYRNAQQVHTTLEPHASLASWDGPDKLTVYASTQGVHALRTILADHFDLEKEQVQVDSQYIGGGFGGKQRMYAEIIAAVTLARYANAPVRVVGSRMDELSYASLRPGVVTQAALVTKADGAPEAMTIKAFGDSGVAIGSLGATMYGLAAPRVLRDMEDANVVNNTPPGSPFRGPDIPPVLWAIEQAADEAACKHNLDPVALRRKWFPDHEIRNRLLDWVEALPVWQGRGAVAGSAGRYKQGVGLAMASWAFIYNPDVQVTVSSSPTGITVSTATQDIGNGTRTALAKAVEDVLGIPRNQVVVQIGAADLPIGPVSGGSQVTSSVYPTAHKAAQDVRAHLVKEAESRLGLQNVRAANGGVEHAAGFTPWSAIWAQAAPFSATDKRGPERGPLGLRINMSRGEDDPAIGMRMGHAAVVAQVEVDTRLGKIRPLHMWSRLAVGNIHVPELARSQVYGGVIQGLGYALYEQKQYDLATGHTLSANLNDYRIPGIGDAPEITVDFDEKGFEEIRGQGVGLAELATVGVAAAVGNAVHHATGWRPLKTPITPQDVVAGLKGR